MLGFKNFQSAAITIADIELFRRIHKHQFALHQLRLKIRLRLQSGMRCSLPNRHGHPIPFHTPPDICTRAPEQDRQFS